MMGLSPPSLGSLGALNEKRTVRSFQMVMMEVGMGPRGGGRHFCNQFILFCRQAQEAWNVCFCILLTPISHARRISIIHFLPCSDTEATDREIFSCSALTSNYSLPSPHLVPWDERVAGG